jgi:hypothetical protein
MPAVERKGDSEQVGLQAVIVRPLFINAQRPPAQNHGTSKSEHPYSLE